ncbi:hypothetical protein GTQ43_40345 [Nostoc sp. KVJ3]|uniref:chemotaxis protein CheB n=1 Tax=Nostoc sp. KVJ3 TaxID=457945 RepID=UPI002238F267|nr:chemotaxis protein CheB [Nostoc sp. KVJ3]MCW5319571.1 hypothetical protein [Nostoc sp. KVJ3]
MAEPRIALKPATIHRAHYRIMLCADVEQQDIADALFPIVGIAASAGGLEAFTELLRHLLTDTGMAFVLIQHLAPNHKSLLSEILARTTQMPVRHHRAKLGKLYAKKLMLTSTL